MSQRTLVKALLANCRKTFQKRGTKPAMGFSATLTLKIGCDASEGVCRQCERRGPAGVWHSIRSFTNSAQNSWRITSFRSAGYSTSEMVFDHHQPGTGVFSPQYDIHPSSTLMSQFKAQVLCQGNFVGGALGFQLCQVLSVSRAALQGSPMQRDVPRSASPADLFTSASLLNVLATLSHGVLPR